MAAPKGHRIPNAPKGRKKGTPNRISGALKDMVLQALGEAGGVEYLVTQAQENPNAFLTLVGKVLPLQVTGADGKDLIPTTATFVFPVQPTAVNRT